MRFIIFIFSFLLIFSTARADEKINQVLKELQQIKKDMQTLEKAVYSQSFKGSGKTQASGSLEGALTRQLVKITELEEQMQKLTASHEEVMFSFEQLNERLNKTQKDNELRLSDLEREAARKQATNEEKLGNKHDNGVLEAGTDEIRQSYQEDTPGQDTEQFIKEKDKAFHEQKKQVKKNFSDVFGNPLKGYPANEEIKVREL